VEGASTADFFGLADWDGVVDGSHGKMISRRSEAVRTRGVLYSLQNTVGVNVRVTTTDGTVGVTLFRSRLSIQVDDEFVVASGVLGYGHVLVHGLGGDDGHQHGKNCHLQKKS
jgi:hypothetical protein